MSINNAKKIDQELIKELFKYKDGNLIWKKRVANCIRVGQVAGGLDSRGYTVIRFNGKYYKAHRLIWVLHFGVIPQGLAIDHINSVKSDNNIDNLRLVTTQENGFNRPSAKGYSWNKRAGKFNAQIIINGQNKYLGTFVEEKDARKAYLDAKEIYHNMENTA